MIEELLSWLQLTNLSDLQDPLLARSLSNVIFIAYIVTMRKSYLFGAAFLLSESMSVIEIIPIELTGEIYGLAYYCIIVVAWLSIAGIHIRLSNNKNTLLCCAIMILFLLLMAWDSYVNAYNQTFIWVHYEAIILCIHVSLIVSLYNNRLIIDGLVGKLNSLFSILRSNVYLTYFCYTVRKTNQGK